jgi:protein translocase SecG subunit
MVSQKIILQILQISVAVLLVIAVLLQQRSGGLGNIFGGTGTSIHRAKRGLEKFLWYATIVLTILFILFTLIDLSIK